VVFAFSPVKALFNFKGFEFFSVNVSGALLEGIP